MIFFFNPMVSLWYSYFTSIGPCTLLTIPFFLKLTAVPLAYKTLVSPDFAYNVVIQRTAYWPRAETLDLDRWSSNPGSTIC